MLIRDLHIQFKSYEGIRDVLYVDEIRINKGETYGIIGESGTGKTVLALSILRLLETPPGKIVSGEIILDGTDLMKLSEKQMQKEIRGKRISMIFQDPMSTMNPVYTVGKQLVNVITRMHGMSRQEAEKKAEEWLNIVKLPDPEKVMKKYPHELSGGQRQRVIIALALACGAEFMIADEPTRNLDVTIQVGILQLLKQLQEEFGMTCLFIANNPSLIYSMCDHVAVFQNGRIVEKGKTQQVLKHYAHPYTGILLNAVPDKNGMNEQLNYALEHRDDPVQAKCSHYAMCMKHQEICIEKEPEMTELEDGHFVKCHLCKRRN
ncbi:MAG TPA: ABC transporter ATP-binding protein [Candidatus Choladousia intestinipullorum]|nr:ABC transporter ATP-binding protein [Candidatus Choladousia intestinipullorum]